MSASPRNLLPADLLHAVSQRLTQVRAAMEREHLDSLLVNSEIEIRYLTAFIGHDSLLLITQDEAIILTDSRYDEYLNPWRQAGHVRVLIGVRHRLFESVRDCCGESNLQRLGVQAERMTLAQRRTLGGAIGGTRVIETTGLITSLRRRKDSVEIAEIERAIDIQQTAMQATLEDFHLGLTEHELGARLEYEMKIRGAAGTSFDPIIGGGANSSIIHHSTSQMKIQRGVLLLDWGARAGSGYCGDMTRTYAVGEMPSQIGEIYAIVLEAQLAAIDAAAPGKTCAEIDSVARSIITKAGYGEFFGHGLGHGLGLEIHEAPWFNNLETATLLEPGHVMTVEPGIYLPDVGGVRIEDDILIVSDGRRVLTSWPKEPDSCVLERGGHARQARPEKARA